jgi:hypothetical protein
MAVLPDGTQAFMQDFDDLHQYSVVFDSLSAAIIPYSGAVDVANVIWMGDDSKTGQDRSNIVPWRAAEALRLHDWRLTGLDRGVTSPMDLDWPPHIDAILPIAAPSDNDHANGVGIVYGIRAIQRQKSETVYIDGSILRNLHWQTDAENQILGPELGMILARSVGRLSTQLQATVMAGFNFGEVNQQGVMGDGLVPGALNRPPYVSTVIFGHNDPHDEISPSGELRAEARYQLRDNVTLALRWSGIAIGNALLTEDRTFYRLPDMGLVDPGEQTIFFHHLFCGVEVVL